MLTAFAAMMPLIRFLNAPLKASPPAASFTY
jgi:hypothetical protein